MKYILSIAAIILIPLWMNAQQSYTDSLKQAFKMATTDSAKFSIAANLSIYYQEDNLDSALDYINQGLLIAHKNNRKINESWLLSLKGRVMADLGKYVESFEFFQEALKITEDPANDNKTWKDNKLTFHQNRLNTLGWVHLNIGFHRGYTDSIDQSLFHFRKALQLGEEVRDTVLMGFANWGMVNFYLSPDKLDSALILLDKAEQIFQRNGILYLAMVYLTKGDIYLSKGDKNKQLYYVHKSLEVSPGQNNTNALSWAYTDLTNYYLLEKQKDSSLYYANKNVEVLLSRGSKNMGWPYLKLSKSYELRNETDSAYKYQGFALTAIDSTYQAEIKNQSAFQKQSFKDQMKVKELEQEKASYQSKIRTNILAGGLFTLLVIAFFLFRNNRQKQKANNLIAQQKEKVESTLQELKSTQSQLIQSEKMASLGELTAGIAHEIQNPLNFVNNFSELNKELLVEMKDEMDKGNIVDAKVIADDVIANQEKINHHGKRADAIVKGMLQHSRSSTGIKEPTDINALADEYLRLAYHGLRAKDKSFNATMKTDYDESIGNINIISQDIGRVILNLITNAFYVVTEKKKQAGENLPTGQAGYEPTVTVSTKKAGGKVLVSVKDNGNGIPQKILDKIFQPFFTTKPTGQGTGLGLSLSYDIVKAHGGEIKVETKEGEGSEFIIQLPIV